MFHNLFGLLAFYLPACRSDGARRIYERGDCLFGTLTHEIDSTLNKVCLLAVGGL